MEAVPDMTANYMERADFSSLSRQQRNIVHLGEALGAVGRDNRAAVLRSMLFANSAVTLDVSDVLIAYGGWLLRRQAGLAEVPGEPQAFAQPIPAIVGGWPIAAVADTGADQGGQGRQA